MPSDEEGPDLFSQQFSETPRVWVALQFYNLQNILSLTRLKCVMNEPITCYWVTFSYKTLAAKILELLDYVIHNFEDFIPLPGIKASYGRPSS